ncbi:hypothetical protein [Nostoc sp.]
MVLITQSGERLASDRGTGVALMVGFGVVVGLEKNGNCHDCDRS